MAKNQRRLPKQPPPKAKLKTAGRVPTSRTPGLHAAPEHENSIWDASFNSDRYAPATPKIIGEAQVRLGIVIPASVQKQLFISNGGVLLECDEFPFNDDSIHWTNATVDGISQVQSWRRASDDHWFDNVKNVKGLHLLVIIAAHSESQLCLDYRESGSSGMPAVTFVDVSVDPTEVSVIAKTVDEFLNALVDSRT